MRPTRECTLVDLIDRILDKGVIINADVIISVAGVPLIGLNLRAALAGIETMLDYGMMEAWDAAVRQHYAAELAEPQLVEGEKLILKSFGSYWQSVGICAAWQPGYLYLTDRRLLLFRAQPPRMLFEVAIEKIAGLKTEGGELRVLLEDRVEILRTEDGAGLKAAIEKQIPALA